MSTPITAIPSSEISSDTSLVVGFQEKKGLSIEVVFSKNSMDPFTSQLISPTAYSLKRNAKRFNNVIAGYSNLEYNAKILLTCC
jgi:hypothetical protein